MSAFVNRIKSDPKLKKLVLWLLIPKNEARPRKWVSWFVNPFFHKKGKGTIIRKRTRLDVLPFNKFELGNHSVIEDFCTVNNGVGDVIIGNGSLIGMGNVIIGPVSIGNDVIFAQNNVLSGLNHEYEDINRPIKSQGVTTKPILIKDETWIGANCFIAAGITIGKHCIVAGGSVVTKDVPDFSIVAGNPARILKQYSNESKTWERIKRPDLT
jgi:acetyltransferase-like isoleucine patch superfamily enzyme